MARYIDADVFVRLIKEKYRFNDFLSANSAQKIIDNIPTADVAPVVHAHWIVDDWDSYGVRNCSNCGGYGNDTHTHIGRTHGDVDGFRIEPLPYCPRCGAKMDEEVQ